MKRLLLTVLGVVLSLCVAVVAVVCAIENQKCFSRWSMSVYESRWTLFGGCQLKLTHERWVPADSVRVFR